MDTGGDQVEVESEVVPKDLRALSRRLNRSGRYRYAALTYLAIATGVAALRTTGEDDLATGLLMLVSLMAWLVHTATFARALITAATGRRRVVFTPGGVTVHDTTWSCTWWWSAFERTIETDTHFLLLLDKLRGHVVPKRCFASDQDVATVRS
jgi:hypothetical protein